MSFQNIGIDNLQASKAFKQIRANSRTYTNNIVHAPSPLTSKYIKLNSIFFNNLKLMNSNSLSFKRAITLTSAASSTSVNSTFLDSKSLDKFFSYNLQYNQKSPNTNLFNKSEDLWQKSVNSYSQVNSTNKLNLLFDKNRRFSAPALKVLATYPNVIKEMGDDSDKKPVSYPYRKLLKKSFQKSFNTRLGESKSIINSFSNEHSSSPQTYMLTSIDNLPKTSKDFMIQYSYQSQPFSKQSVRRYKNLHPYTTNYNLSSGLNPSDSNLSRLTRNSSFISPFYTYNTQKTN
jgi:hypothetical protein